MPVDPNNFETYLSNENMDDFDQELFLINANSETGSYSDNFSLPLHNTPDDNYDHRCHDSPSSFTPSVTPETVPSSSRSPLQACAVREKAPTLGPPVRQNPALAAKTGENGMPTRYNHYQEKVTAPPSYSAPLSGVAFGQTQRNAALQGTESNHGCAFHDGHQMHHGRRATDPQVPRFLQHPSASFLDFSSKPPNNDSSRLRSAWLPDHRFQWPSLTVPTTQTMLQSSTTSSIQTIKAEIALGKKALIRSEMEVDRLEATLKLIEETSPQTSISGSQSTVSSNLSLLGCFQSESRQKDVPLRPGRYAYSSCVDHSQSDQSTLHSACDGPNLLTKISALATRPVSLSCKPLEAPASVKTGFAISSDLVTQQCSDPYIPMSRSDNCASSRGTISGCEHPSQDPASPVQEPACGSISPPIRLRVSSRMYGPVDAVEGMEPGSGADRLIGSQKLTLPKGDVNGFSYCCEAQCGYPDYAADMIRCDSDFHRTQSSLQLPEGESGDRGWYHRGCSGLESDDYPTVGEYLCQSCIRRGTLSTGVDRDHAQDDNIKDRHQYGAHQYEKGKHDAGQAATDDYSEHAPAYHGSRGAKRGQRNHGMSAGQGGGNKGAEDICMQGQSKANSSRKRRDTSESYPLNISDSSLRETSPQYITRARDPWTEEEKILAMKIMRKIDKERTCFGEDRFEEIAQGLQLKGFNRRWGSVKNAWNRGLRERSGFDERKNRRAPLTTSKQDAATKKRNRAKRSSTVGIKRKHESDGEEEEQEED